MAPWPRAAGTGTPRASPHQTSGVQRGAGGQFERVGWFQTLLNASWPAVRGCLERDVLRGVVTQQLGKAVPGLHFGSAYLGDSAPQLCGVKAEARGEGREAREVQLVFDLGFHPGPSIDISLNFGPLHAAVSDLHVHGQLCVRLVGLVPRTPVVSGIKIFFADAPELSFGFSGLAEALPISPQKVKGFVVEAISSKMVLPHSMDVHLDSLARMFREPDFLDYHNLHSIPPAGVLTLFVLSLEGRVPSETHTFFTHAPALRVQLRLGSQTQKTLIGSGQRCDFIVDSPADQAVYAEIYREDHTSLLLRSDELLTRAKIPVPELALACERDGRVQLDMAGGTCCLVLSGAFRRLAASPPRSWDGVEALLQITVDCVVGLPPRASGKRYTVRAEVLPRGAGVAATAAQCAGEATVTEARVLHTALEQARTAEAKDRIRLLLRRGAKVSAEDVSYLLAGMVTTEEAAVLLREVEAEGKVAEQPLAGVELLFAEQLRVYVGDPRRHGLCIELWEEQHHRAVGVVEWSSLAFLAKAPSLEDELQAYTLERTVGEREDAAPTIFLKRAFRIIESRRM